MYDARQIANWFVREAASQGRNLSIMQLLKLVYIAHGWHLAVLGYPLFNNRIEAWKFGPVIPDVYRAFKADKANDFIVNEARTGMPDAALPSETVTLLESIYDVYGSYGAFKLSDLTHEPGTPWYNAYHGLGAFAPISNDNIAEHYAVLDARMSSLVD